MKKLLFALLIIATGKSQIAKAQASATICAGNGIIMTYTSNLTSVIYTLEPGGLTGGNGNPSHSFTMFPTVTTVYTITAGGFDATNTPITTFATYSITVNPTPTAAVSYTQSTCTSTLSAFSITISSYPANASPAPSYTIDWLGTPGSLPPSTNNTLITTADAVAGVYTATMVATGGCTNFVQVTLTPQPQTPTFTFAPIGGTYSLTCVIPEVSVSVSDPNHGYVWTSASGTVVNGTSNTFSVAENWTVVATSTAGCVETHTLKIVNNTTLPVLGSISPQLQNITCINPAIQTITVTATSPTVNIIHAFVENASGQTTSVTSNPAIFSPGIGDYTYYLINAVNGCSVQSSFTIETAPGTPTFEVISTATLGGLGGFTVGCTNPDPNKDHSKTVLSIINASTTPTAGGALLYAFIPPGGSAYTPAGAQSTVVSVPGTWTVVAHSVNNSCELLMPVSVIQNTVLPNIAADVPIPVLSCFNPSTTLTGMSTNETVDFSWGTPIGNSPNQAVTAGTITPGGTSTSAGNYTLTVFDKNNGCISTSVVAMKQNVAVPIPSISVTGSVITCLTPTLQLTNSSKTGILPSSGYPSGQPIIATLWEGPSPQPTMGMVSSYVAEQVGTYTMTIRDENNGCYSKTTTVISDNKIFPVITPSSAVLDCGAKSTSLTVAVSPAGAPYSYVWTTGGKGYVSGSNTVAVFQPQEVGTYTVVVTNTLNGCASTTVASVVKGVLISSFTADKTSGYAPLTVTFNNTSASSSPTGSLTSAWNYGNGITNTMVTVLSSSVTAPPPVSATYNQPGNYTVTLYTAKGLDCPPGTNTMVITVDIPSKLEIPNVFTPNGDGINDIFFLKTSNLTKIKVLIYDRWGHLAYEVDSETGNISWDGKTMSGQEAAAGTYFYIITATGKDGQEYDEKGTLTLSR